MPKSSLSKTDVNVLTTLEPEVYRSVLAEFQEVMEAAPKTPFHHWARVVTLTVLNMRYEKIAFNRELLEHPYQLTRQIILEAIEQFNLLTSLSFVADSVPTAITKSLILEEKHCQLWQEIWPRHSQEEFNEFIALKRRRFAANNLESLIAGRDCVEFGCGNGAICFALLEMGARSVTGIDFGEQSVAYARQQTQMRKVADQSRFEVASVLESGLPSQRFEFAVANGVFHHLNAKHIPVALAEVARVLKSGSWFWYYVDGSGAISMDLWDTSVFLLREVDIRFIEHILQTMSLSRPKMVFIMDGLTATYIHSTWDQVTQQLAAAGFGNFRRLAGGEPIDLDGSALTDPYAKEKFGEGDIRILCQRQ